LTINTPHVNQSEKLTPAKYQESETRRLRELFSATEKGCWVAGNDPGRRNIATQAILLSNSDPLKDKASRVQFTRSQWQRLTRARQQREWESSRRVGDVKIALNALSDSGGKRGCSEERWEQYISKSIKYQSILHREFLENDERRRRAFDAYGCRHRAVDNTASRLVTSPDGKPLIIGYGDGNFPSHGRGKDTSVPTKTLFRAVKKAFKAKNIEGGVMKVWEHNTTAKCHRCHARLDKIYKTVEGRIVENLDFRRCSHCGPEKLPKMRNRDWNAALNIRVVMMAILNGEDRPVYLKPDKIPRRKLRRG
jgi:Zn finger protein HypA/HybF involved in hydrogenase expression